jgi:hypothetical protein
LQGGARNRGLAPGLSPQFAGGTPITLPSLASDLGRNVSYVDPAVFAAFDIPSRVGAE